MLESLGTANECKVRAQICPDASKGTKAESYRRVFLVVFGGEPRAMLADALVVARPQQQRHDLVQAVPNLRTCLKTWHLESGKIYAGRDSTVSYGVCTRAI
jgi:hypothetical protein